MLTNQGNLTFCRSLDSFLLRLYFPILHATDLSTWQSPSLPWSPSGNHRHDFRLCLFFPSCFSLRWHSFFKKFLAYYLFEIIYHNLLLYLQCLALGKFIECAWSEDKTDLYIPDEEPEIQRSCGLTNTIQLLSDIPVVNSSKYILV